LEDFYPGKDQTSPGSLILPFHYYPPWFFRKRRARERLPGKKVLPRGAIGFKEPGNPNFGLRGLEGIGVRPLPSKKALKLEEAEGGLF